MIHTIEAPQALHVAISYLRFHKLQRVMKDIRRGMQPGERLRPLDLLGQHRGLARPVDSGLHGHVPVGQLHLPGADGVHELDAPRLLLHPAVPGPVELPGPDGLEFTDADPYEICHAVFRHPRHRPLHR